jgi:hypothetical protein
MTISTPLKIVALAALALALGLGGVALLLSKHGSTSGPIVVPPVVHHTVVTARVHRATKPRVILQPGLPAVIRAALLRHATAVVVVYNARIAGDRVVLAEARAGAHTAHAAFIAANVAHNRIAAALARWSNVVRVPAVLVAHRPGAITFAVSGTTDRNTVAQAALSSK